MRHIMVFTYEINKPTEFALAVSMVVLQSVMVPAYPTPNINSHICLLFSLLPTNVL